MHDLNAFQRDCLYVIGGLRRPQGTEIKAILDQYYPTDVNYARLYPALDALVAEGHVEKTKKDGRTNEYTLTETGWNVIQSRRHWERKHIGETLKNAPLTEVTP